MKIQFLQMGKLRYKAIAGWAEVRRHKKVSIGVMLAVLLVFDLAGSLGVHAASQGPNAATSATQSGSSWLGVSSAEACDGVFATVSVASGSTSVNLNDEGYGFTIPTGSTINGIQVDYYHSVAATASKNTMEDATVQLIIGGTATGSNLATTTAWSSTIADYTYGSSSTLWGLTPTAAQINASNFGVAVAAKNVHSGGGGGSALTAQVDCVDVTVTYTAPAVTYTQSNYRFYQNQNVPSAADGSGWTEAASAGFIGARQNFSSLAFDNKLWVMGGSVNSTEQNDIWSSPDGVNFTELGGTSVWTTREGMAAVVYNNEMWVLGGYYSGGPTYLNDVWVSTDGSRWTEQTASAPWVGREFAQALVYNNKLWVIGGDDATGYLDDAWYTTDGINWTEATTGAGCPTACSNDFSGRYGFGATVFNNKMWVAGGTNGTYQNDVWYSTDGATWTEATTAAGWGVRDEFGMVSYNGYLWAIGGYSGSTGLNDVWCSSDGVTWSDSTSGTPACGTSGAAWTGRSDAQTVIFNNEIWEIAGYVNGVGDSNDLWYTTMPGVDLGASSAMAAQDTAVTAPAEGTPFRLRLDLGVSSTNLSANGQNFSLQYAPLASYGTCSSVPTANYAAVGSNTPVSYYYQNATAANGESLLDTNSIDPTETGTINKEEYLQSPRAGTESDFSDPVAISSGQYGVWDFALTTYHALEDTSYCLAIFTDTGGTIAALNTYSNYPEITTPSSSVSQSSYRFYQNQDASYLASAWTQKTTSPWTTGEDEFGTAVFNSKLWVVGGWATSASTNDVWSSSDGVTWSNTAATWSARYDEGVVNFNNTLYVMGGYSTGYNNDIYSSTNGSSWTTVLSDCTTSCSQWDERMGFVTLVFNNKIWVMGGDDGTSVLDDVWSSSNGSTWTQVTTQAPWVARSGMVGMVYDGKMWIMGGSDSTGFFNDVWYSSDGATWTEATADAAWPARNDLAAAVYNNQMYILAGYDGSYYDDVWSSADGVNWTEQTTSSAGTGLAYLGAASFNGSLWELGGSNGSGYANGDWAYNSGAADVGTPWANQNEPLDMTKYDSILGNIMSPAPSPFRLRWDIDIGNSGKTTTTTDVLGQTYMDLRLQYAEMVGGSCSATNTSGTWADVTTTTPVQWYTGNTNAANGNPIIPDANDPTDGSNGIIYQTFVDQNYFGNSIGPIYGGQDGLWDLSLALEASPPHTSYCLRVVYDNGSGGDYGSGSLVYNSFPQINVAPTMIQLLRGREWWNSSEVREYKDIK